MTVLLFCPVCEYLTLHQRGAYEICPVCEWEDEGIDHSNDTSIPTYGPNDDLSIDEAKRRFESSKKQVNTTHFKQIDDLSSEEAHSMILEIKEILSQAPQETLGDASGNSTDTLFAYELLLKSLTARNKG